MLFERFSGKDLKQCSVCKVGNIRLSGLKRAVNPAANINLLRVNERNSRKGCKICQ